MGKTKEIIYYCYDSKKDPHMLEECRVQLRRSLLPIIYVSESPINFIGFDGRNIVMTKIIKDFKTKFPGYYGMFKKILTGLEASDADYCFMAEDDVLYSPTHFEFTPPKDDVFYYNRNVWHLRNTDGFAISYTADRLSQLCGNREFLIKHFKKRLQIIEELGDKVHWYAMGFEPGTHHRKERVDDYGAESWMSKSPSIDIKDGNNATSARWSQKDFRSQKNCQNWKEADMYSIPGWNRRDFTFL